MSIAVVTDSTADIPSDLVEQSGLTTVAAFVRFGDDEFRDGVGISTEEFYSRLARDKDVFPTTSQPSPGDFKTVYDELLEENDEIVSIHISSAVSGTYASAVAGAAQTDPSGERIKHVDSRSVSMATGFIALAAQQIIADGGSAEDALMAANEMVTRVQFAGTPDTLEYLKRGGRLKGAQALMAGILNIRPVLAVIDGEVGVRREAAVAPSGDVEADINGGRRTCAAHEPGGDAHGSIIERRGGGCSRRTAEFGPIRR